MSENITTILLEVIFGGFFATACIRAGIAGGTAGPARFASLFRLTGRLERLRRTRWQWASMAGLMLVLRLQHQLPPVLEAMAAVQFVLFLAIPTAVDNPKAIGGGRNEAVVGSR